MRLLILATSVVLAGILCLFITRPIKAQRADPRTTIDLALTQNLPNITAFQTTYVANKGRYFQALWSHSTPPVDGGLVAPDLLDSRPTDQAETWRAMWDWMSVLGGRIPMRARVDTYSGPKGQGFVIVIQALVDGVLQERVVNVAGSETYREQAWHPVETGQ